MYDVGEIVKAKVSFKTAAPVNGLRIRFEIRNSGGSLIGTSFSPIIDEKFQQNGLFIFEFDTSLLTPGRFIFDLLAFTMDEYGTSHAYDGIFPGFTIDISHTLNDFLPLTWKANYFGDIHLPEIKIK